MEKTTPDRTLDPFAQWCLPDGTLHTKKSMRQAALAEFRRLRQQTKPSLPQDGSRGQYDAYTETMIAALDEDKGQA